MRDKSWRWAPAAMDARREEEIRSAVTSAMNETGVQPNGSVRYLGSADAAIFDLLRALDHERRTKRAVRRG